jgi:hypothetical protein
VHGRRLTEVIQGLSGTSDLTTLNPISAILDKVVHMTVCDRAMWKDTCKAILSATCPYAVQTCDAAIADSPSRGQHETLSVYYARFNDLLSRGQWVRLTLDKDASADWLSPFLDIWTKRLGNSSLAAATLSLPPGSTLYVHYAAVEKAVRIIAPEDIHNRGRPRDGHQLLFITGWCHDIARR